MIDFKAARRTRMANSGGRLLAAILIGLASLAAGCASGGGAGEAGYVTVPQSTHSEGAPAQVDPGKAGTVVGVWNGLTLANCSTSPSNTASGSPSGARCAIDSASSRNPVADAFEIGRAHV